LITFDIDIRPQRGDRARSRLRDRCPDGCELPPRRFSTMFRREPQEGLTCRDERLGVLLFEFHLLAKVRLDL